MTRTHVAALAVVAIPALAVPAHSEVTPFQLGGFTTVRETVVETAPAEAFDAFTGDISGWWDHSFSGNPAKFVIEPHAPGAFYEVFPDGKGSVKHADVIYVEPGKLIRLDGPLGFSGDAVHLVISVAFAAEGEGTRVRATINLAGQITVEEAELVGQVWDHFLGRFRDYVAAGGQPE